MNDFYELKDNLNKIEEKIKVSFENKGLLLLSFVHRSFINENKKIINEHNERLEFLGDVALNLVVSTYLYNKLGLTAEGKLSHIRSNLVDGASCARYYKILELDPHVLLSKGEKEAHRGKTTIFADAFEALIGAIYLDRGFLICSHFIIDHFSKIFEKMCSSPEIDYKGKLQEYSQKKYHTPPEYRVLKEKGPEHQKTFDIVVIIDGKEMGYGSASSKKLAEIKAAENAYNTLNLKSFDGRNG
ncbi:MAG: Ribonuclease 3 [Candidatus Anoxychlamydiales bacterium]|nr:Ribonuclease 3 [Candidatus Anoxychlamydiales bacterium]